jgi:hypothetical protein
VYSILVSPDVPFVYSTLVTTRCFRKVTAGEARSRALTRFQPSSKMSNSCCHMGLNKVVAFFFYTILVCGRSACVLNEAVDGCCLLRIGCN